MFVRSERWKVRYPMAIATARAMPKLFNPLATHLTAKPTITHTHRTHRKDALETLLSSPLSGVPSEGDLLPICAEIESGLCAFIDRAGARGMLSVGVWGWGRRCGCATHYYKFAF